MAVVLNAYNDNENSLPLVSIHKTQ